MTSDLLQSDIDLTRALIGAGKADTEIVEALGLRRISAEKAHSLVRNLRDGLPVEPDPPSTPKPSPSPGSEQTGEDIRHRTSSQSGRKSPDSSPESPGGSSFPWFGAASLLVLAIVVAALIFWNRGSKANNAGSSMERTTRVAAKETPPALTVEIEPQKLRVSGNSVSRANALGTLTTLLGAPSRTNRVSGLTVYAYDKQGMLLYSENQAGNDSLLLYFETVGGANGTQSPFAGTLTIQSNLITASTDPKTLADIPQLALNGNATNAVLSGDYCGIGLSFAYLKTPGRLSLVQIDLK